MTALAFKEGVVVVQGHGLPHIWKMLEVAIRTAPELKKQTVVCTEGWRLPRHPDDAHTWGNAFDIRVHNILEETHEKRLEVAWEWVERMRAEHSDPRYQFVVHGEGQNAHIHMEFDPR